MDAVLVALGLRRGFPLSPWSRLLSPHDLTERSVELTVRAMQKHCVRRVVAISAAGVGDSWTSTNPVMRTLIRFSKIGIAYRDLAAMERVLETSGLDWMAVRPVTLTNLSWPPLAVPARRYRLASSIPRAAVTSCMLDAIERREPFTDHTRMVTGGWGPFALPARTRSQ
jgi:hypothetical protein